MIVAGPRTASCQINATASPSCHFNTVLYPRSYSECQLPLNRSHRDIPGAASSVQNYHKMFAVTALSSLALQQNCQHIYNALNSVVQCCWDSCPKCPTVKMLISYLLTRFSSHWYSPPHFMNKKGPSLSLIMRSLSSCAVYTTENIKNGMSTARMWIIGRNICGFIYHYDTTCQDAACDSYLWYSITRILNTEHEGNTILRIFRNSAKSHKKRTVSTLQQHSRQNLKSDNSKAWWLNWAIPVSLLSY